MTQPRTEAFPFPTATRHDPPPPEQVRPVEQQPSETALDSGVEESFPASDPVSVNITKVEATPPRDPAPRWQGRAPSPWSAALRTGLIAGAFASVASTAALAWRGMRDAGSPLAPTNAVSHWLWGREAYGARTPSWRHTALGYATHHASAVFWATLYAWLHANRRPARSTAETLAGAGAMAAAACAIDYTVTPKRLRPGFEQHLSKQSMTWVYAALAVGLAVGCAVADRGRRR